jgi:(S)-2-hydroxy-acid oxidase
MEKRTSSTVLCNVNDFQTEAKRVLPKYLYEYLASGSDEEQTLAENRAAYSQWYLQPRILRSLRGLTCATTLLGQTLALPVFVSPAGVHALCDADGECATAQVCREFGTIFGLSQHATRSIEQVAASAGDGDGANLWYQCYMLKDRALTARLLRRAVAAGYRGIFFTVDSVRFGFREADERNGFNSLPDPHRLENYDQELSKTYNSETHDSWDQNSEALFDDNLSFSDIRWIKEHAPALPVIVKGVMTPEDAEDCIRHGADGIMVSNHGGRQLDGGLATIDALPAIAEAVGGRVPILLDGGIRRGTDILKALALGATAVGIGKPVFFALAVHGKDGVRKVFRFLRKELETAMALCGVSNTREIARGLVCRHPTGSALVHYQRAKL